MQVDELLKPFPIKEFHPFPRAMMGPGAHEMIGPEALKLGFKKTLVMTSGLRGSDIVHKIVESMKYHGLEVVVYDKVESNPKDYNVMDAVGAVPAERLRQLRLHRRRLLARRLQGRPHLGRARRPQRQRVRGLQQVARTRRTRRTSPSPPRPAPARRRRGPTSSPTPRPTRTTRTSTSRSTTPRVATLAIDDPVLYYSCPIDYTAQCGFDVLAHASEPYVSRLNFQPSLGNALHAIKLTAREPARGRVERPGPRRAARA